MTTVPASIPVLRWAAHRARLHGADLVDRFRKWPLWLSGEAQPTLKQLEDFARLTHTAIGYFFLPEPPTLVLPVPDFRTLRDKGLADPDQPPSVLRQICRPGRSERILASNKTRQGYARKRILKPAGYFFVAPSGAVQSPTGAA